MQQTNPFNITRGGNAACSKNLGQSCYWLTYCVSSWCWQTSMCFCRTVTSSRVASNSCSLTLASSWQESNSSSSCDKNYGNNLLLTQTDGMTMQCNKTGWAGAGMFKERTRVLGVECENYEVEVVEPRANCSDSQVIEKDCCTLRLCKKHATDRKKRRKLVEYAVHLAQTEAVSE